MTRRQWSIRVAIFSLAHFFALVLLKSFIYLLVHIPTPVVRIDKVIIGLTYVQQFLTLPRWLLRHLWFGETTPTLLNWALLVANSVIWGLAFAWLTRNRWRNAWEKAV
jgi:hypothetical protein